MDGSTDRTSLGRGARNWRGRDFTLLDAYLAMQFTLGETYLTLRAGNQVLNWGESTFLGNGINAVAPIDVSKLRAAGAELREALRAVPLVDLDWSLNERISIEAFYELAWDHTEIDPEGTFFATSDAVGPGGKYIFLGFGKPGISDDPPLIGGNAPVGTAYPRARDRDPDDTGQFGIAVRWFEPALNGSEFGFYFTRLHSRLPLLSGRTGTVAGLQAGDYASSASCFREFPEKIDTYGISFNTDLAPFGAALQGEFSYRRNQPLQAEAVELSFAMLSPLDPYLDPENSDLVLFGHSQLGAYGFEEEICGYRRKDMMQAQATVTKVLGPHLKADQIVLLGEVGATFIEDMEDTQALSYEAPATDTSVNPLFTTAGIQPETQRDGFAEDLSWGYRLLVRGDYNGAIGAVNLQPRIAFAHDVHGTTPSPIGNFVDGRMTITTAVAASFLLSWTAELSYTNSFGAGGFNLRSDRDFVTLAMSYSF
jgi:hypothetical protein